MISEKKESAGGKAISNDRGDAVPEVLGHRHEFAGAVPALNQPQHGKRPGKVYNSLK